jgi:FkbH-like protein
MASDPQPLLAISATFTAEPIEETLAFWFRRFDLPLAIQFAPYNQVFQELLGEGGVLRSNLDGVNVILLRPEDWQSPVESKVEENSAEFVDALCAAATRSSVPYLVCLCPPSPSVAADETRSAQLSRAEDTIATRLKRTPGIHVVTSAELAHVYGVLDYYSPHTDELGHIPYTPDFFVSLGTMVARRAWALRSPPYKAVALDCDGTLWQGICGEDGASGVRFDGPWRRLQEFMVEQHDAGMLLCLCSKNSEHDVLAVFDRRREEMPLKREHLVSWRVSWAAKSASLRSLAAELGLALDSFIFLDDSPAECAEVRANCPEVLTLQLPSDPRRVETFLLRVWAFDHLKITSEDKGRTEHHRANIQRESVRAAAFTMEDFLEGLDLRVGITRAEPDQLERVAQLTQRTNQFNVSGVRRTRSDVLRLCESGRRQCLVVQVRDRFGDYGMVGALLYAAPQEALVVDSFLLSCRALGKRVEHRMLSELGRIATELHAGHIDIPFIPSARNRPALDFLESFGHEFKVVTEDGMLFRFPSTLAATVTDVKRGETHP